MKIPEDANCEKDRISVITNERDAVIAFVRLVLICIRPSLRLASWIDLESSVPVGQIVFATAGACWTALRICLATTDKTPPSSGAPTKDSIEVRAVRRSPRKKWVFLTGSSSLTRA